MFERTSSSSFFSALFPKTTFWRYFTAAVVISCLTIALAMGVALWIGRSMVYELQNESGYIVLRNAVDMITRSRIAFEGMRNLSLEDRKRSLRSINSYSASLIDSYNADYQAGAMSMEEARFAAFEHLNDIVRDLDDTVFVIDRDFRLAVHPDPAIRHQIVKDFQDSEGERVYRDLTARAKAADGEPVYALYPWIGSQGGRNDPRLAAALYYKPWNIVICSEMSTGDIDRALAGESLTTLNELRARLGEIIIAKTGYVFFFDESCNMIAHPTLAGMNFSHIAPPGAEQGLCKALISASESPWGQNRITYDWDRPETRGEYAFPMISWCGREPTTGWFVAVSAYVSEIESAMPRFIWGIFLPSLGSVVLLSGALAFLVRRLLKPVRSLTRACQKVSRGDLNAAATEKASGEMGFLCGQFNIMVDSLRELRGRDQERRKELEELNRSLERMVELRTRALERKAEKLEQANERLLELDQMKSTFLSSVSHELRTPLTSIRGFAKLIHKEFKGNVLRVLEPGLIARKRVERISRNLEIIYKEGERLTRLINDVLDLAKIEAGQMDWRDSRFSLVEAAEGALLSLEGVIQGKKDLCLRKDFQAGIPMVRADMDRMRQLFINLLDNAVKFTPKGVITLQIRHLEGTIRVGVCDTGRGMDKKNLLSIFNKFHQAEDTLKEKPKGTGLGLAICANIVHHYGGEIWAESAPGRGTVLAFEFPADESQAQEAEAGPPVSAVEQREPRPMDERPRILVVDDDPSIRSYLVQVLESEGYAADMAADGLSACRMALENPPDLVTLDILMPGMNGREVLAAFRENPNLRNIPIVVISVLPERDSIGGDAAIAKPIDEERLIETVHGLIRRDSISSRPCLILTDNGEWMEPPILLFCGGQVSYCNLEELMMEMRGGFEGTIFIPSSCAYKLDFSPFAGNCKAQVVLVSEKA